MKHLSKLLYISITLCLLAASVNEAVAQFRGVGQTRTTSGTQNQRYYSTNGMIGEAIIEADHDSRSLIVITDDETNEHIMNIIKQLDRPVQQVLIKVVFLELTYRDDYDFGMEGSIDFKANSSSRSNLFQTAYGVAAETRGGFYQILEDDLNLTIRAMEEVGRLEVLSRPSILTRNNQEAIITVGQEVPFIRNSQTTDNGNIINTVEYEDIGIILQVTPFITKDGLVEMILSPEISTITDETVPISENVNSPVFAKRSANTVVATPNGQTVVIGGMMEDNTTETVKKIPILGDIPLLGLPFKRTVRNKGKTELLIFLTPYVVDGPEELIKLSELEADSSDLTSKTFSKDRLDDFLDKKMKEQLQESKKK
jgi:general secretion pathway protein D